jgi:hypothetical protein
MLSRGSPATLTPCRMSSPTHGRSRAYQPATSRVRITTRSACRAHGTRGTRPVSSQPPPDGCASMSSAIAAVTTPVGSCDPANVISHPAISPTSTIGSDAASDPSAGSTTAASAYVAPAPPLASGTTSAVTPISSKAVHACGCQPVSASSPHAPITESCSSSVVSVLMRPPPWRRPRAAPRWCLRAG